MEMERYEEAVMHYQRAQAFYVAALGELRRQPLPRLLVRLEAAAAGALVLGQRHAAAAAAALGEAGEVHLLPVGGTVQRAPLTRQLLRQQLVQTEAMIKVEPGLVLWLLKTECTRPCVTEPPIER